MPKVVIENPLVARIIGEYKFKPIDKALSYYVDGYRFMPAFRRKGWDGKVHLLNRTNGTFPAGLAPLVGKMLNCEVVDRATPSYKSKLLPSKLKLRDYQKKALARATFEGRGVIKMPTGSGKTQVGVALHYVFGGPTLVLVHKRTLVRQWAKRFRKYDSKLKIQTLVEGKWEGPDDADVYILNIGSVLQKRGKKANIKKRIAKVVRIFKRVKVLIGDEAHHTPARTFRTVMNKIPAPFRFGLSATPFDRSDDKGLLLEGLVGPIIYAVKTKKLIKEKHVAQARVCFLECDTPDLSDKQVPWAEVEKACVTHNEHRNKMLAEAAFDQVYSHKKQVLMLVRKTQHGYLLLEKMLALGADANEVAYVTRETSADLIEEVVQAYARGEIRCIIASPVIGEGDDLPSVDVVVNAAGEKSVIDTLQRAGRGSRTNEGKKSHFLLIDVLDTTHRYVIEHTKLRLALYETEGFDFIASPADAWM